MVSEEVAANMLRLVLSKDVDYSFGGIISAVRKGCWLSSLKGDLARLSNTKDAVTGRVKSEIDTFFKEKHAVEVPDPVVAGAIIDGRTAVSAILEGRVEVCPMADCEYTCGSRKTLNRHIRDVHLFEEDEDKDINVTYCP
ncbi:hypothetical protein FOZ63_028660, partial [Perkinsus olseni]